MSETRSQKIGGAFFLAFIIGAGAGFALKNAGIGIGIFLGLGIGFSVALIAADKFLGGEKN